MRASVVVILLCLSSNIAVGQIVNVQSTLGEEPKPGLSGALAGSADWRTGNQEFVFLGLSGVFRHAADKNLWVLILNGERKTSAGDTLAFKTFSHLRYRRTLSDRWQWETFLQHSFDQVRRLRSRTLAGTGPRVILAKGEVGAFELGAAYMYEHELLDDDATQLDASATQNNHRLSSYAVMKLELSETAQFLHTTYFQPRLNDVADLRLLSDTSLVFRVSEDINFATALSVAWDRKPPGGVENVDTALVQTFSVEF